MTNLHVCTSIYGLARTLYYTYVLYLFMTGRYIIHLMYDIVHGISSRDKIIHFPAISKWHHTRGRMILEVLAFCARAKKARGEKCYLICPKKKPSSLGLTPVRRKIVVFCINSYIPSP